jgi:hypothetical protein
MPGGFRGAIFDVDGVLVGSPHEQASREAPSSASAAGNAPGTPDDPGDGEQADPGASFTN